MVSGSGDAQEEVSGMTAFVLVPGAWLGGWSWRRVAGRLRAGGHEVYPVTLTGLGDRSHLARPEVDLETHVADIVRLVEQEDLREAVLLGHSYGGVPVTGAASRLGERLAWVVYLDSAPIPDGTAYMAAFEPEAARLIEGWVGERGGGWQLPLPAWEELETVFGASLAGLDDGAKAAMRAGATPQPFATYTQPLRLAAASGPVVPKLAILNSFGVDQIRGLIAAGHPWGVGMSGPEWTFAELPTGHWPMFSRPDDLADLLLKEAEGR
jgi:pimeloyl-ACP methyl ester carboxylesterase